MSCIEMIGALGGGFAAAAGLARLKNLALGAGKSGSGLTDRRERSADLSSGT